MFELLKDQSKAISKLSKFKVGALFMEPGTGKTLTAYNLVKSVPGITYLLWLTPFQTKNNLSVEIEKYGGFDCKLDIIGIETLSSSDRVYLELRKKVEENRTFIVCDESLKIKNMEAKRTRRILDLGSLCKYKLILNGTPLSRNVLDLWAQFQFLSPEILNMQLAQFKNTFCRYTTITKKINGVKFKKEFIDGYENIDYLYALIKHYVYECTLDVSIKQNFDESVYALSEQTSEEYNGIKDWFLEYEYKMMMNSSFFLAMIQKLQITYCIEESKFDILNSILLHEDHRKTIVFCKFIRSREEVEKRFPNVKVLTYGKHSYGLNLQDYNVIVFFDKTLDYALRLQAMRRIFRTGQAFNCMYYDLTADVGLERMIDRNISTKSSMPDYFKRVSLKTFMEEL